MLMVVQKRICIQRQTRSLRRFVCRINLHFLDASVRHLGTDINYVVLENLFAKLKDKVDFYFETPVDKYRKKTRGL